MQNSILLQNIDSEELLERIRLIVFEAVNQKLKAEKGKDFLTKKETAARLRISLPTLQRMTNSGSIKGFRIGRRVLYRADEVDLALKNIETIKYKRV